MTHLTRCDLHVHSNASVQNDEWYTKRFSCPESYAAPIKQYLHCKARGMSLVTLTDHDTIAGGLQLIDRPDFFLSEEITSRFPENGCVIHVLAWNITPAQHEGIQAVREDVYQLVEYLRRQGIAHACAHPLLSPNWKLDAATLEKILLLFPALEVVNGLTDRRIQGDLTTILDSLDPRTMERLSRRHGLLPHARVPHRHALTAGSDDHVHRRCGSAWTQVDGARGPGEFLEAIMAGQSSVHGEQSDINAMALCIQHTTYHFLKLRADEQPDYRDPVVDLIDVVAGRKPAESDPSHVSSGFVRSMVAAAVRKGLPMGQKLDVLYPDEEPSDEADARVVAGMARLSDGMLENALDEVIGGFTDVDMYRLLGGLRDLTGAMTITVPYLFGADHFGRQVSQGVRVRKEWSATRLPPRRERLAVFSDSLGHVDGVSSSCERLLRAAGKAGKEVFLPYCGKAPSFVDDPMGLHQLPTVSEFHTKMYSAIDFYLPSPVAMIDWLWRNDITHVEIATPGPMGVVALAAARLLRLPVTASYHTEVPELLRLMSANDMLHRASRGYLSWFYAACDRVFAFSHASRQRLISMGVSADKIEVRDVAVDPEQFTPEKSTREVFEMLDVRAGDRPVILSVGRLSKEKNIPIVIEAVEKLQHMSPAPVLVVAGDGPERGALEEAAAHKDFVHFVGLQQGETLQQLYASARMFVFASQVDTLGLVTMEAMASGLPVLVPSSASITEVVRHGFSGHCYDLGVDGLADAIRELLEDEAHTARLSENARREMVERWKRVQFGEFAALMQPPPPRAPRKS
jgi:glycosyltransferase involved in cell wall biosynthesis